MSINTQQLESPHSKNRTTIGSYKQDLQNYIEEFNAKTRGYFVAENRILIPAKDSYSLDRAGIIIEHDRDEETFEEDFNKYQADIENFANKLDKRTTIYEYSFYSEFCKIDNWITHEGKKVAYNLNL